MKPPKEPKTFTRPRLYYQPLKDDHNFCDRIRIIWPNGLVQYMYLDPCLKVNWTAPCWAKKHINNGIFGKFKNGGSAHLYMLLYDDNCGWPPAEFLGEL